MGLRQRQGQERAPHLFGQGAGRELRRRAGVVGARQAAPAGGLAAAGQARDDVLAAAVRGQAAAVRVPVVLRALRAARDRFELGARCRRSSRWGWGRCCTRTATCSSATRWRRRPRSARSCCWTRRATNRAPARTRLRMLLAGLLAGLTVMFEYQAALVSIALGGLRDRALPAPRAGAGGVRRGGAAAGGRARRLSHGRCSGGRGASRSATSRIRCSRATAHSAGFHGLSLPHLSAFPSFLFSPSYGLFAFSPVLVLGVAGVVALFVRAGSASARRDAVLVTAVCLLMFTFLAGMSNWRAGWCVGPRYIATVAPFLLLPLLKLWPRVGERWWATAIAVGLIIPSVLLNVVSGALYPHYPEAFDNPVFDLAFPLIGAGLRAVRARLAAAPAGGVGAGAAGARGAGGAGAGRGGRRSAAAPDGRASVAERSRSRRSSCSRWAPTGARRAPTEAHAATVVRQAWEPLSGDADGTGLEAREEADQHDVNGRAARRGRAECRGSVA